MTGGGRTAALPATQAVDRGVLEATALHASRSRDGHLGRLRRRAAPLLAFSVLVLFHALPGALDAQRRGPGRQDAGSETRGGEDRLRRAFSEMITKQLGLTADEQTRLSQVLREFGNTRRELARRERRVRAQVDSALSEADDTLANVLLDELASITLREVEVLGAEQRSLLDFLTPVQVLRYLVLREELGLRIRMLRENRRPNLQPIASRTVSGTGKPDGRLGLPALRARTSAAYPRTPAAPSRTSAYPRTSAPSRTSDRHSPKSAKHARSAEHPDIRVARRVPRT